MRTVSRLNRQLFIGSVFTKVHAETMPSKTSEKRKRYSAIFARRF